jgi:hypothetical protein
MEDLAVEIVATALIGRLRRARTYTDASLDILFVLVLLL